MHIYRGTEPSGVGAFYSPGLMASSVSSLRLSFSKQPLLLATAPVAERVFPHRLPKFSVPTSLTKKNRSPLTHVT
jgi:hypothetical protein